MLQKLYMYSISMVMIQVMNGCGSTTNDTQGPQFTIPQTLSISEGTQQLAIVATDKNGVIFNIVGGADANKFVIDAKTGILRFVSVPDYEAIDDANRDHIYEVVLQAEDTKGNSTRWPLSIRIIDDKSDNGPTFTSANSITLKENSTLDFTVTSQPAEGGDVHYAIVGGPDHLKVTIDAQSGRLGFAGFIPDFDFPSDDNRDNRYEVMIQAKDDQNHTALQNFSIIVRNDDNDLVPTRIVWKTGQDDGVVEHLSFGEDRNFKVQTNNGDRIIIAGNRMWEDSPHSANVSLGYDSAVGYCEGLNYGGFDDWRAPSRHELAEMLNYGKIDADNMFDDVFHYRKGGNYWTHQEKKSSGGGGSALAWSISFDNGGIHDKNKAELLNIRCIRGKKIANHSNFSVDGDIVIDNTTGIMWQNAEFTGAKTWQEAKTHCKELVFGGYDDWRLPNVNELRTIMPYDDNEILFAYLSPIGNGNLDSGHSWSTTQADSTHAYYNLNDWDEVTNRDSLIIMHEEYPKTDNSNLMLNRCIRGGHL